MTNEGYPVDPAGAQAKPRLFLAAAIALLFHVILAVALLLRPPTPEPEKRTVQVQLVDSGSEAAETAASATTTPTQKPTPTDRTDKTEAPSPPNHAPPPVATRRSEEKQPVPEHAVPAPETVNRDSVPVSEAASTGPGQQVRPASPSPRSEPDPEVAQATASSPTTPAGAPVAAKPPDPADYRQESSRESLPPMDPYQLTLSRHMMRPIKQFLQREATLRQFNKAVEAGTKPITIELKLLSNGAVRRVQLKESSGSDFVDRIAVQSALAASPYPPPPEEARTNGFRFKLYLIMSPVYL